MKKATLLFLIKKNQILLARKKRGLGKGFWNGVGGKVENGETIRQAAARETAEEIGVTPKKLRKVAILDFKFPKTERFKSWNQRVYVYLCDVWEGKLQETQEMVPKWFNITKIPYHKMWADDIYWLPRALNGEKIRAKFIFKDSNTIAEYRIYGKIIF